MSYQLNVLSAATLVLSLALTGCAGKPAEAPGPPTVTVSYPLQREVTDYEVYTGRTAAVDSVQVQARVTGYLQQFQFSGLSRGQGRGRAV
jgi:multidrug efflux system membrane fusion protein